MLQWSNISVLGRNKIPFPVHVWFSYSSWAISRIWLVPGDAYISVRFSGDLHVKSGIFCREFKAIIFYHIVTATGKLDSVNFSKLTFVNINYLIWYERSIHLTVNYLVSSRRIWWISGSSSLVFFHMLEWINF